MGQRRRQSAIGRGLCPSPPRRWAKLREKAGRTGAGGYYHNGEFSGSGGMPARERWSQTGFCGMVRRKPHNSLRHASRSNTEESVGFNSQYTSANCENSVAVSTLGMLRQARGLGNRYENRLSNMRQ